MNWIKNRANIIIKTTDFIENTGEGDYFHKNLSQCLYGLEIYHFSIRQKIYESLNKKKTNIIIME